MAQRRVDFTDVEVPSTIAGMAGKSKQKGADHITSAVRKQPETGPQLASRFLFSSGPQAMDDVGEFM